jgi:L-fuculose-phosphate aldolase
MKHARLRRAVVETARRMAAAGLVTGTAGNVSVRAGEGFLVTPSGAPYDALTPASIVATDLSGGYEGDLKPSTEWRLHADLYRTRPEAQAVVHTHSTCATALSTLRRSIPAFHYMIAAAGGNSIECADYATFGTEALSRAMLAALGPRRACLLANHGVVAYGASLAAALALAVVVEELARQYGLALQAGAPVILDDAEMARVHEKFRSYGPKG